MFKKREKVSAVRKKKRENLEDKEARGRPGETEMLAAGS